MSKKTTAKVTITGAAAEKVSPEDYASCSRESRVTIELEIPVTIEEGRIDFGPGFENQIKALQQSTQFSAEASVYSGIARAFSSRGQPSGFFVKAAWDRMNRSISILESGTPEGPETICMDPTAPLRTTSQSFGQTPTRQAA
jgi:hypothetical protein